MTRIIECNCTHSLNLLAAECLKGYPWSSSSTLAALVLIEAHWDVLSEASVLNQHGGPTSDDTESMLSILTTVDPDTAMSYLTMIGGKPAVDIKHLHTLDGVGIAHELLQVVASQMMLGVELRPR